MAKNKKVDMFINKAILKGMEGAATEFGEKVGKNLQLSKKLEKNENSVEKLVERQLTDEDDT
jgi:hypothetical protein